MQDEKYSGVGTGEAVQSTEAALAAENARLRSALEMAVFLIRQWHGIRYRNERMAEQSWGLYQSSPEMKPILAALAESTPPVATEAAPEKTDATVQTPEKPETGKGTTP